MGRRPGSTNASQADIDRGLLAWITLGTAAKAAAETGFAEDAIQEWKRQHPERYRELTTADDIARARAREDHIRQAAEESAAALPRLLSMLVEMAGAGDSGVGAEREGDRIRAAEVAAKVAEAVDRIRRLDAGEPTSRNEDGRTDEQVTKSMMNELRHRGVPEDALRLLELEQ